MLQPLRTKPDYGEKGHRPQDFTEDELVEMARELTVMASVLVGVKMSKFFVYISKQYFPKEMWPDAVANDAMYKWVVMAPKGNRSEAALKAWKENGRRILDEVNPWVKRISLHVSGGTGMGTVEAAGRLSPIQVHPVLKAAVNPYLNTPPTELRRDLETEKNAKKREQMKDALNAWRTTVPGPFWRTEAAKEILAAARMLLGYN